MNASTFTCRSSRPRIGCRVGGRGRGRCTKGALHGGARPRARNGIRDRRRLTRRGRCAGESKRGATMGFGHRIYRVRDPRADAAAAAERLYTRAGDMTLYTPRARSRPRRFVLEEYKGGVCRQTSSSARVAPARTRSRRRCSRRRLP
jgi:citrate synthase